MSQLERVLFPEAGITRRDLLRYYVSVADVILPHLKNRPLTVRRWPHGITEPSFYQKHEEASRGHVRSGEPIRIETIEDLVHWVRIGAIEFHAPLGTWPDPNLHDWAVIDLDPNPPAGWGEVRLVATAVMRLLERIAVPCLVKTSGSAGLHLYIRVRPVSAREATAFVEGLCRLVVAAIPDMATVTRRVSERGPRVYLDYLQNGSHRTMAVVYTVRAREGASVSCPVTEREVLHTVPSDWTIRTVHPAERPLWEAGSPVNIRQAWERARLPPLAELRRG